MNAKFINQYALIQTIMKENTTLKDKNKYLEDKLREIIKTKVADLKASKVATK